MDYEYRTIIFEEWEKDSSIVILDQKIFNSQFPQEHKQSYNHLKIIFYTDITLSTIL